MVSERELLIRELGRVNDEIERERHRFNILRDDALLDETIYKLMALTRRQGYLINKIKEPDGKDAGK